MRNTRADEYDKAALVDALELELRFCWRRYRAALLERRSLRWCPHGPDGRYGGGGSWHFVHYWLMREWADNEIARQRSALWTLRFIRRESLERHQTRIGFFLVATDDIGRVGTVLRL